MKKLLISLIALSIVVVACGDDDTTATTAPTAGSEDPSIQMTAEEREWCTLSDSSDATALRFDQIFEAGSDLSLPMDALNAQASELRTTYEGEGMSPEEAITRVSELLLEEPVFVEACQAAYARLIGG